MIIREGLKINDILSFCLYVSGSTMYSDMWDQQDTGLPYNFPMVSSSKSDSFFYRKSPFCSKDKLLNGCEAWSTKEKSWIWNCVAKDAHLPCDLKCRVAPGLKFISYCAFVMRCSTCTTASFLSRRVLGLQNPVNLSSGDADSKNWRCSLSTWSHSHKVLKTQVHVSTLLLTKYHLAKTHFSIEPMSFGHAESIFIELHENFSRNNTSQLILLASST